jgi:serine/threonine protein kinase/HSP20 family molecular chaperone IbpA
VEKDHVKSEMAMIEEMCADQEGFLVGGQSFFADQVLWIVCDFEAWSEGTVRDIMSIHTQDGHTLDEQLVRAIGAQLLAPLEFLHSKGRIFRDLRCKNLMVTPEGKIQLQLFTLPSILQERSPIYKDSLFWASPELLLQERVPGSSMSPAALAAATSVGPPADVWALGITLLELALGDPPLCQDHLSPAQIFKAIVEGEPAMLPPEIAPLWSKGFKEVIQKCLVKDVSSRATIADLKSHPFFSGAPGPEYIKEHLLSPLPPIDTRWKLITQIREQLDAIKQQERKEAAEKALESQPGENPDNSSSAGSGTSAGGPGLGPSIPGVGMGPSLSSAPSSISSIGSSISNNSGVPLSASNPTIPNLGLGPSIGPTINVIGGVVGPTLGMTPSSSVQSVGMGPSLDSLAAGSSSFQPPPGHSGLATSTGSSSASGSGGSHSRATGGDQYTPRSAAAMAAQQQQQAQQPENPFLSTNEVQTFKAPAIPGAGSVSSNSGSTTPTTANIVASASNSSGLNTAAPPEPTRGRFRIVNPGTSGASTPHGSVDMGPSISLPGIASVLAATATGSTGSTPLTSPHLASTTTASSSSSSNAPTDANLARRNSKSQVSSPSQTPVSNVPIEAYLGENEREYLVIFRTIPGTIVSVSLEGRTVVITGQVPPLPSFLLKQISSTERPTSKFERKVRLPGEIDPNEFSKELLREQNTMVIRVKKCPKSIHLGEDIF